MIAVNNPRTWHFHYLIPPASKVHARALVGLGNRAWFKLDPFDTDDEGQGTAAIAEVQVANATALVQVGGELHLGLVEAIRLIRLVTRELGG